MTIPTWFIPLTFILFCFTEAIDEAINREVWNASLNLQKRLHDKLLRNYDKSIPAFLLPHMRNNNTDAYSMEVIATYAKFLKLNEPEQYASLIFVYYVKWTDIRLSWDPSEFEGVSETLIDPPLLWTPDVFIFDVVTYYTPLSGLSFFNVVYSNGTVLLYTTTVIDTICLLDINNFPFDAQSCYVGFCAAGTMAPLCGSISESLNIPKMSNGEFTVTSMTVIPDEYYNFLGKFDLVLFHYTLVRSPNYYIILIIIPSFILTLLTIIGTFWSRMTVDSFMEKIGLGFASMAGMMMVLQITTDHIPKTSQMPIISIFILINIVLVGSAVIVVLIFTKFASKAKFYSFTRSSRICAYISRYLNVFFLIVYLAMTLTNFSYLMSHS